MRVSVAAVHGAEAARRGRLERAIRLAQQPGQAGASHVRGEGEPGTRLSQDIHVCSFHNARVEVPAGGRALPLITRPLPFASSFYNR